MNVRSLTEVWSGLRTLQLSVVLTVAAAVAGPACAGEGCTNPQWQPLGAGIAGLRVSALIEYGTMLVAGGQFDQAGGVPAQNLAAWDGFTWRPLGNPDGRIEAVAIYNGNLIVGGSFTSIGGIQASNIASWNGYDWQPLGAGTDGTVQALFAHSGHLYVGGRFANAGGQSARNIARWSAVQWHAMGNGLGQSSTDQVETISFFNQWIVAGGRFAALGNIAYWDGATWRTLGQGIPLGTSSERVLALAKRGQDYHVAGRFTRANGAEGDHSVTWLGPSAPGSFLRMTGHEPNASVQALLEKDDWLYAVGAFTRMTNVPNVSRVGRWNGDHWEPLGLGVNGEALAIASFRGGIMVGGTFSAAGGIAAINIAAWACPFPTCNADVNCDFALDGFDVQVQEAAVGGDTSDYCQPDPDFNRDFAVDGFDVQAVELVVGGGPCP